MRILIGYDGSDCSREAIETLRRSGLPQEAEALVVSVADMWPILPDPEHEEEEPNLAPRDARAWKEQLMAAERQVPAAVAQARAYALERLEEVRAQMGPAVDLVRSIYPRWKVESRAVADSPYWGLTKLADTWGADLVVVGSHGRSALGRVFLGSVSLNVVNYAHCSVRVARCSLGPQQGPARLVVGYDGSEYADAVIRAVGAREWPEGSEARLLAATEPKHVTLFPFHVRHEDEQQGTQHESWLRGRAERQAEELRAAGLATELFVKEGDPKRILITMAEEWSADAIFIGAKGLGGFKPLVLGSVATSVVSNARCTVEVIRPARGKSASAGSGG